MKRRTKENRASSCEAAFLLVTFCCDCHSNTKCLKQIQHFAISQLIRFLSIHTVIKRVSTFTCEARAALFEASTGGEDDLWPHYQSLWTRSIMKEIHRFIHEVSPLLPDLSGYRSTRRFIFFCVVSSYSANIKYKLSPKCFELSACNWLWSFASLALMLSHSIQLTLPPIQKTLLVHAYFVSVEAEGREGSQWCCCCSLHVYLLFIKFSS